MNLLKFSFVIFSHNFRIVFWNKKYLKRIDEMMVSSYHGPWFQRVWVKNHFCYIFTHGMLLKQQNESTINHFHILQKFSCAVWFQSDLSFMTFTMNQTAQTLGANVLYFSWINIYRKPLQSRHCRRNRTHLILFLNCLDLTNRSSSHRKHQARSQSTKRLGVRIRMNYAQHWRDVLLIRRSVYQL